MESRLKQCRQLLPGNSSDAAKKYLRRALRYGLSALAGLAADPEYTRDLQATLREHGAHIGRDVFFGPDVFIETWCAEFFTAEDGVVLAPRVTIILHDAALSSFPEIPVRIAPVTLKKECYIGACSVILPGVTIGERAIIGAGSLVTKRVADGMVAYGHPAKEVCNIEELRNRYVSRMTDEQEMYLDFGAWRDLPEPRNDHIKAIYDKQLAAYLQR